MNQIKEILDKKSLRKDVNVTNVNNNLSNNVKVSNVNVNNKDEEEKIKYLARELATKLNDFKSLNFYLKICREHRPEFLYECLAIAKDAQQSGEIKTTMARYFVGVVKRRSSK